MVGWVRGISWSRNVLRLGGWATDGDFRNPASQILVFVDGEAEDSWYGRRPRPDVGRHYPGVRRVGYLIELGYTPPRSGKQPEIRVFAISVAGTAPELHYRNPYHDGNREYVLGKPGSK